MKNKVKTFFAEIWQLIRLKPVVFATLVFNAAYGLVNIIISTVELSLFIGTTGIYSIIFGVAKGYGLTKLKKIKEINEKPDVAETEKAAQVKAIEKKTARNISIFAAAMSFLHFSFAIVCIFFFEESTSAYQLWYICFIAAAAFIKIIIAAINSIRTRKKHSIIFHHMKLMDFANSLISLALLQRAILYFLNDDKARFLGGIGGIVFSLAAMLICLGMFFRQHKKDTEIL